VHALKAYEGAEAKLNSLLTLSLNGAEWSYSNPGHFMPGEKALGTK